MTKFSKAMGEYIVGGEADVWWKFRAAEGFCSKRVGSALTAFLTWNYALSGWIEIESGNNKLNKRIHNGLIIAEKRIIPQRKLE